MLLKKIKKILCVISAVIIAVSGCCISASAATNKENDEKFSFYDIQFIAMLVVYDKDGNVVEEKIIPADKYEINSSGDSLYVDISSSEYSTLFHSGNMAALGLYWEPYKIPVVDEKKSFLFFEFSKGVSVLYVEGSNGIKISGDELNLLKIDSSYICPSYESFRGFFFTTDRNFNTFSFVATLDYLPEDYNLPSSSPIVAPGMFKFFKDIGTFFTQSVSWVSDIFDNVVSVPALNVMVLGFVIAGFVFALLFRLTRN